MSFCDKSSEPSDEKPSSNLSNLRRRNEGSAVHAVIFDLDGVIVDSEPNHFEAFSRALVPYGFHLEFEYFKYRMVGISPRESLARVREDFRLTFDIGAVAADKDRFYEVIAVRNPRPNSLILELVHRLRKSFSVALASGASTANVDVILRSLNLSDAFDAVVSGDEVRHGKPDPEIFRLAAKKISVCSKSCAVLEDSLPGIEAAKRAGMRVIAIRSEYTSGVNFPEVNFVIESVKSVDVEMIEEILLKGRL
jgi:HAD superfamily hydrolase (TIGR01509 family)